MARVHPDGWQALTKASDEIKTTQSQALQRELATLNLLASRLADDVTIYHGVHWTRLTGSHTVIDDIDFVLISPRGKILLIEQVAGFLTESSGGLIRRRSGNHTPETTLETSMARTVAALTGRLRRAMSQGNAPTTPPVIDTLLYCPDYKVLSEGSAGLPPERIVDARRAESLPEIVNNLLESDLSPEKASIPTEEAIAKMHRFFSDLLQLVPDASAVIGTAQGMTTRLSGGLSTWARRLRFSPHRLRVIGTAGSGKTQLALAVMTDAAVAGRKTLYICYNRPLADHVCQTVAGATAEIATFHQLSDRIARQNGKIPDFSEPDAFRRLESVIAELPDDALSRHHVDELIVDEGQDFESAWAAALFRLVAPGGRIWWLEDPMQNLYRRPPAVFPDADTWVELRCERNYRTPRAIMQSLMAMLGMAADDQEAASPIQGHPPEILGYLNEAELIEQTKRAIGMAIAAGFRRNMIAVLSFRGRERSLLARQEKLGPYPLRTFTGEYDLLGNPIQRDGDIHFESVMRFKGQSAPCVILTEVQFATLDENAQRRLFVGATRATMALFIVAHQDSAAILRERQATSGQTHVVCQKTGRDTAEIYRASP